MLMPIILVAIGCVLIFYLRPKQKNAILEIKYMQTKSIKELLDSFAQMDANGLGDNYREYVELKGYIKTEQLITAPFSNKEVAYCDSSLIQVIQTKEQYRDNNGNIKDKVTKHENVISNEKSSQEIHISDESIEDTVSVEINASGCEVDLPKTFDRFEPKNNLSGYKYFNNFSWNGFGAETIGFKMTEKTINKGQNLYVIGEAFKVGNKIHIGKPMDNKKPFIVTTKSEEDLVNASNRKSSILLIGGIVTIVIGIVMLIQFFMK